MASKQTYFVRTVMSSSFCNSSMIFAAAVTCGVQASPIHTVRTLATTNVDFRLKAAILTHLKWVSSASQKDKNHSFNISLSSIF